MTIVRMMLALALAAALPAPAMAQQEALVLYGAGSLRESMGEMAAHFAAERGVAVRTQFGASGRMRERIEAGEKVDVFTSADLGHAAKLVADGRASVMAMFACNDLCLLVPAARAVAGSAADSRLLLEGGLRVGVSPARIDPLGDYTVQLFDRIDKMKPGSGKSLHDRSVVIDNPPGSPPSASGDYVLDALRDGRIDIAVVYCSGKARYARLNAGAAVIDLPSELAAGSQYGLAVMKAARPEAMLLALTILSPSGQKILAASGFRAVANPDK